VVAPLFNQTRCVRRLAVVCAIVAHLTTAAAPALAAQEEGATRASLPAAAASAAAQATSAPWATECAHRLAAAKSRRLKGVHVTELGVAAAATGLVVLRFWGDTAGWGGFLTAMSGASLASAGSQQTGRANEEIRILAALPGCTDPTEGVAAPMPVPAPSAEVLTSWQAEVAATKARRSAGRKEERIGAALFVASQVVALSAPRSCGSYYYPTPGGPESHKSCNGRGATALTLIGAGVTTAVLGHRKAHDADAELAMLTTRGPRQGGLTIAVPAGATQTVGVTLGPNVRQVIWRIRW
jgi:hypothetical protein